MSFIIGVVRPDNLQKWIATNAPASIKKTVGDSWRAYLSANGGTGKTLHDLETTFLNTQAISGGSQHARWGLYLTAQSGKSVSEKARAKYQ